MPHGPPDATSACATSSGPRHGGRWRLRHRGGRASRRPRRDAVHRPDRDRRRGRRGHRGARATSRRSTTTSPLATIRRRATGDPDGPARRLLRHGLPRDAARPRRTATRSRSAGSTTGASGASGSTACRSRGRCRRRRELLGATVGGPLDSSSRTSGSGCSVTAVRRRSIGRDLDGHDAARGPDDGDAGRLDRPWHRDCGCSSTGASSAAELADALDHRSGLLGVSGRTVGRASAPRRRGRRRRASDPRPRDVRAPRRGRHRRGGHGPATPRRASSSPGASGRTARRSGTGSQAGSAVLGVAGRARDRIGRRSSPIEAREDLVIAAETVAATGRPPERHCLTKCSYAANIGAGTVEEHSARSPSQG